MHTCLIHINSSQLCSLTPPFVSTAAAPYAQQAAVATTGYAGPPSQPAATHPSTPPPSFSGPPPLSNPERICSFFNTPGGCNKGDGCLFIHAKASGCTPSCPSCEERFLPDCCTRSCPSCKEQSPPDCCTFIAQVSHTCTTIMYTAMVFWSV